MRSRVLCAPSCFMRALRSVCAADFLCNPTPIESGWESVPVRVARDFDEDRGGQGGVGQAMQGIRAESLVTSPCSDTLQ